MDDRICHGLNLRGSLFQQSELLIELKAEETLNQDESQKKVAVNCQEGRTVSLTLGTEAIAESFLKPKKANFVTVKAGTQAEWAHT